jgi:hypothetical protein
LPPCSLDFPVAGLIQCFVSCAPLIFSVVFGPPRVLPARISVLPAHRSAGDFPAPFSAYWSSVHPQSAADFRAAAVFRSSVSPRFDSHAHSRAPDHFPLVGRICASRRAGLIQGSRSRCGVDFSFRAGMIPHRGSQRLQKLLVFSWPPTMFSQRRFSPPAATLGVHVSQILKFLFFFLIVCALL